MVAGWDGVVPSRVLSPEDSRCGVVYVRPHREVSVRFIVALMVALSIPACGGDEGGFKFDPAAHSPGERGPFNAGYRVVETTYTTPSGESRTVPVHLWYPTRVDGAGYSTPTYGGILIRDPESFIDAPPAEPAHEGGRYPVLVYSHGHQGLEGGHHRLMKHLASQGWLGVAVGHVGNRLFDEADHTVIPLDQFIWRATDVSAALDALDSLPEGDPLAGRAETSRVVLTGHSRGTYSAWAVAGAPFDTAFIAEACEGGEHFGGGCTEANVAAFDEGFADARVVAIVPTAGGGHAEMFGGFENMTTALPVLYMTAEGDAHQGAPLFESVPASVDLLWVELSGGCHEIFNTGFGCVEDVEAYGDAAFFGYATAFSRRHVLGEASEEILGILDGSVEVRPEATLHAR
jgi:predicted dienelactone hydrolase